MSNTFEGKPCRKCGCTTRFTGGNHNCVECNRRYQKNRLKLVKGFSVVALLPTQQRRNREEPELPDMRFKHLPPMPWTGSESGFIPEIPLSLLMGRRA